jgi:hypothetical protein
MAVSNGPKKGLMISAVDGDAYGPNFRTLLRALDTMLFPYVIDHTLAAPPSSPANGAAYIVAASASGAWAGRSGSIAVWSTDDPDGAGSSGEWEFYTPEDGWVCFSRNANGQLYWSGSAWTAISSGGGGGGGSSTLAGDTDVDISSPSDGQALVYNASAGKWENATLSGGGGGGGGSSTLAGDTDVDIASPSNGQVLTYSASAGKWENATPSSGGGGGIPSGSVVIPCPDKYTSTNNEWSNYSFIFRMAGSQIVNMAAAWKISIAFVGGTGYSVHHATVMRTLHGNMTVIDVTPITFGGNASILASFSTTPTLASPFILTTDAIELQLDAGHDYYICFYFDADADGYNSALLVPESCGTFPGMVPCGYLTGDQNVAAAGTITWSLASTLLVLVWEILSD